MIHLRRRLGWAAGAAACAALALWLRLGPLPPIDPNAVTSATILDRNGVVLYEPLSPKQTRGEWITAADIPPRVAEATIAAEDRRFRGHIGIDPIAVARAAAHDLRHLRVVEGGSTITQQVAKLLLGSEQRGITEKVREAVIALRLEHRYSKDEILALYLNLAPYGAQTNGIARASRRWFGRAPEDLTVAQAAFLAALPQRPSASRASARQRVVLARMRAQGFLDDASLAVARSERLRFDRGTEPLIAPHFVERVRERGGNARVVRTTLDARLQSEVRGILAAQKASLLRHGAHSAAVAVLDNRTGEWLAWEGSGDYFGRDFGGAMDGVTALRQPGSALKPFTYALAFEQGHSPATVLADVPASFPTAEEGVIYTPRNYDGRYRGPLRARLALAGSENVPAVAMLAKVGPPSLLRLLRRLGFHDLHHTADYYGLGLTLGDAEVTLEQLVTAYSVFARGGTQQTPHMLQAANSEQRPAISEKTAFWITDILSDPAARAYAFGSGGSLDFPFPVAVKTGTSQAYRDNWTVGYTRDVTVGVWVGNFDRAPLRNSSGITGAGPIFHDVMLAAMKGRAISETIVDPPPSLERAPVCALSGLRPSTSCPNVEMEWVAADAPVEFCSWHHAGWIDWPSEYREWARANEPAPPARAPARTPAREASLKITSPPDGTTYLIDPTLRMSFQSLPLRATNPQATFRVDGHAVAARAWPLAPGRHVIAAEDGRGGRDKVTVFVR